MIQPLVSIIVPCYNQALYLRDSLQSVLEQTYQNWECIIVNDGSPDNTHEIAQSWLIKDERFRYLKKENGGLSSARNAGIENAQGEFILPLDADDKISDSYIYLAIKEFEKDKLLKVVYCDAEKFENETGLLKLKSYSLKNLAFSNLIFCSALFKKSDWVRVGGFDTKMIYGLEDWEFWISILKSGGSVKKINSVCFFYRVKDKSMVQSLKHEQLKYLYEYMSIKHVEFFVEQLGSFKYLLREKELCEEKRKSEKHIIDSFLRKLFGFTLFKTKNN